MKILFVVPSLYGGGAERVIINLSNCLSENNEIFLHSEFSNKGNKYTDLLSRKVKRVDCPKLSLWSIRKAIIGVEPDIVLSTLPVADIRLGFASFLIPSSLRKQIAFIKRDATILQPKPIHTGVKNKIIHGLSLYVYKLFDFFIANSNDTKLSIIQNAGICDEKIQVIGNPVYEQESLSKTDSNCQVIEVPQKYVLAVGRLVVQKRFNLLIEAFNRLKDSIEEDLVILGEGPLEKDLREQVKQLGLTKRVHFLGFKSNLKPYYLNASCYVMSSSIEGFGNVVVEAMSCGTPVICAKCKGGPLDIIENGKYGLITDETPVGLADGIHKILNGVVAFRKEDLIRRAQDYSIKNISNEYYSYFEHCLRNKTGK